MRVIMKIVYNKYIPLRGYLCMNLLGLILFVRMIKINGEWVKPTLSKETLNHENIHSAQYRETLWLGFLLWYAIEYLLVRVFHKKQVDAYHDVSFEEEAYMFDKYPNYLNKRKHYAWIKYIKIRSNEK